MNQIVEDRRVRRTKKLLKEGLCYMLQEKAINEITIKEITDVVDLNRRTFYLHYQDIYDLFEKMENDVIQDITQILADSLPMQVDESLYAYLNKLIEYIHHHFAICKVLFQETSTDFINKSMQSLINCFEMNQNTFIQQHNSSDIEYTFTYFMYGIFGVINLWINEDPPKPVDELTKFLYHRILNGY